MSKLKYSAGNIAATNDENPTGGGSLNLMGSLFLVSAQKNPGTGVSDDRNSTSYSGAEYSWEPIENMYGEDTFIRHSVWSENEDDVYLGNKLRDVMVIDSLAENIIPAEFPDDYEELFYAN